MTLNSTHRALQNALDNLDNYEAMTQLDETQLAAWSLARDQILAAMGAVVAIHLA